MKRREFIKTSVFGAASILVTPSLLSDPSAGTVGYEDAARDSKYRREYLDGLLETKRESYPYIKSLSYVKDPVAFGMQKEKTLKSACTEAEYDERIKNFDIETMKHSMTVIDFYAPEICNVSGKEVFVLPLAFRARECELGVLLQYRNGWGEDVANGIVLDGEGFDHTRMNHNLTELLISLRTTYDTLESLYETKSRDADVFHERFSDTLVESFTRAHENSYAMLKSAVDVNRFDTTYHAILSPYEEDVVKKHLTKLGKWVSPSGRFIDPSVMNA